MAKGVVGGLLVAVILCGFPAAWAQNDAPALLFAAADSGRLPPLLMTVERLAVTPQAPEITALAVLLAPWWEGEITSAALVAAPPALHEPIRAAVAAALKHGDHPAVTQARQWLETDRLAPFPPSPRAEVLDQAASRTDDPALSTPAEDRPDPAWYYQKLLDDYRRRMGIDPSPRPTDPNDVPSPS